MYELPTWVVYEKLTPSPHQYPGDPAYVGTAPSDLAQTLMGHIHASCNHFTGANPVRIDRWTVANEMVRNYAPGVTLVAMINDVQWIVNVNTTSDPDEPGRDSSKYPNPADDPFATPPGDPLGDGLTASSAYPTRSAGLNYGPIPVYALIDDEIVSILSRADNILTVARGQANTTPAPHASGAVIYTIRDLVRTWHDGMAPIDSAYNTTEASDIIKARYWMWRTITDRENSRVNDISDIFLVDAFKQAQADDPYFDTPDYTDKHAKLILCDAAAVFPSDFGQVNQKFENLKAMLRLLIVTGAPVDGMGLQFYCPVWSCLTNDNGTLRLNPKQLRGMVDCLTAFAAIPPTPFVAVSEIDVRMGIPANHTDEYNHMNAGIVAAWATGDAATTVAMREQWQGAVYKAILDASLAVPSLYSFSMWGIVDKYSWLALRDPSGWPWTPEYPDPAGNNGDLLGGYSCVQDAQGKWTWDGVYKLKPAYWGVRDAIVDYFGNAYKVKDSLGNELVRFVENGAVIVFKGTDPSSGFPSIREGYSAWSSDSDAFSIENSGGQKIMDVTQEGELHLAGNVYDALSGGNDLNMPPSGCAFVIRNSAGIVECLLDDKGNLNTRGTVIMNGVPYTLEKVHGSDSGELYSTYN